jgi:hypothetical protein
MGKYSKANCLGYALGRNQFTQLGIEGEEPGSEGRDAIDFRKPSLINDIKIIRFILNRYPHLRLISKKKVLKQKKGKTIIAFRYGDGDFHFVKRHKKSGRWYHKPGRSSIRLATKEYVFNEKEWPRLFVGQGYSSRLFFFEVKE